MISNIKYLNLNIIYNVVDKIASYLGIVPLVPCVELCGIMWRSAGFQGLSSTPVGLQLDSNWTLYSK